MNPNVRKYDQTSRASMRGIPGEPSLSVINRGLIFSLTLDIANGEANETIQTNENRGYLAIQNNSLIDIRVNFGSAATRGAGWLIGGGGFFEPLEVPTNSIYISAYGGTADVTVLESMRN